MCTLSLLRLRQGYSLMFNRDESPEREPAAELAGLTEAGRLCAIYPVDPPSQGSFVGVNRGGASYALLNQYPRAYTRPAQVQSRGRLLPLALLESSAIRGLEAVASQDLSTTPPFLLFGVDEEGAPLSLRWDGKEAQRRMHEDGAYQTSSSGRFAEEALPHRRKLFDRLMERLPDLDDAAILEAQQAYHLSQEPQPGPLAVWMHREESRTVSFSHALVLPQRVVFRHWLRQDLENGRPAMQQSLDR